MAVLRSHDAGQARGVDIVRVRRERCTGARTALRRVFLRDEARAPYRLFRTSYALTVRATSSRSAALGGSSLAIDLQRLEEA